MYFTAAFQFNHLLSPILIFFASKYIILLDGEPFLVQEVHQKILKNFQPRETLLFSLSGSQQCQVYERK